MSLFKSKRTVIATSSVGVEASTWPSGTLEEIDDAAFAAAIERGRADKAGLRVTVAA